MPSERTGYAPWSLTREAGVESATVDGTIKVPQNIQPVLDTGFVDEKGDWKGVKSSDKEFIAFQKDEGIPNTGEILTPSETAEGKWPLDMTGYKGIQIAIKPTRAGNYAITAIMGPDSNSYANLSPVDPASDLFGAVRQDAGDNTTMTKLFNDTAHAMSADVWNIFMIADSLRNQKLLQFKITNNSGGNSDIETAFMRLV